MESAQKSTGHAGSPDPILTELDNKIWQQLVAAPTQKENAFKTCTLATRDPDGWPDARIVVLRQADKATRSLLFHSDVRAQKVAQLHASPQALLLFWDPERQLQLRCRVTTQIYLDNALAERQWQETWAGSRKMYLSEFAPGCPLPRPYPGFPRHIGESLPSPEVSETGRPNFAVVVCALVSLDALQLSRAGQTRAGFTYETNEVQQTWLAP